MSFVSCVALLGLTNVFWNIKPAHLAGRLFLFVFLRSFLVNFLFSSWAMYTLLIVYVGGILVLLRYIVTGVSTFKRNIVEQTEQIYFLTFLLLTVNVLKIKNIRFLREWAWEGGEIERGLILIFENLILILLLLFILLFLIMWAVKLVGRVHKYIRLFD